MIPAFSRRHAALLIIIIAAIIVAGAVVLKSRSGDETRQAIVEQIVNRLAASYERQASQAISAYLLARQELLRQDDPAADEAARRQWATIAGTAQTDLLALRVPEHYRDVHLQLVLLLAAIETAAPTDLAAVETSDQKLDSLISQYPWLVEDLTLRESL